MQLYKKKLNYVLINNFCIKEKNIRVSKLVKFISFITVCKNAIFNKNKKFFFYFFFNPNRIKKKSFFLFEKRKLFYASLCFFLKLFFIKNRSVKIPTLDNLNFLLTFLLKSNWNIYLQTLIDIIGYDTLQKKLRFGIVYNLASYFSNFRILISIKTNEVKPVSSLFNLFPGSVWPEREIWDLYGVLFKNHPDLRRILTDYSFKGFPLRKDFPLSGFIDLFYDDKEKKIAYVPIELAQEFRIFSFRSTWF